jgi:hypothetical protein
MRKYYITYSDKEETIIADNYMFDDTFLHFSIKGKVIFMVNKSLIVSMSVSTEEISYNDIDLSKFITDNFASEFIFNDDVTIGNSDYYSAALNIILGVDNQLKQFGNFNKKCFATTKDVKNKLTKDFIINAIKSHLKNY